MSKKISRGIGDTVEKITEATGIKQFVELLEKKFDFNCGCQERKEKLNKLFPYTKVECLTEEEYNLLKDFNFNSPVLDSQIQIKLLRIYNRVFNQQRQMTSCSSCWRDILSNLKKVLDEYEPNKI